VLLPCPSAGVSATCAEREETAGPGGSEGAGGLQERPHFMSSPGRDAALLRAGQPPPAGTAASPAPALSSEGMAQSWRGREEPRWAAAGS